jgi:hypothetical protein
MEQTHTVLRRRRGCHPLGRSSSRSRTQARRYRSQCSRRVGARYLPIAGRSIFLRPWGQILLMSALRAARMALPRFKRSSLGHTLPLVRRYRPPYPLLQRTLRSNDVGASHLIARVESATTRRADSGVNDRLHHWQYLTLSRGIEAQKARKTRTDA